MKSRGALAWLVGASLLACADETTSAATDDIDTGTETTESSTDTGIDTTESGTDTSDTTDTGDTETGTDTDATDPCPADGCLCFAEPVQVADAPELPGNYELHDLDGDGLRDRVDFGWAGLEAVPLFEVWLATGPDGFASEPTPGPMLPADFDVYAPTVADVDLDGSNDILFTGGTPEARGLFFVPAAELWAAELVEHRSPIQSFWTPTSLTVARLGQDPFGSAILLHEYSNLVEILTLGDDGLLFAARALLGTDSGPTQLLAFDLDDDADLDVVTLDEYAQGVSVFAWEGESFGPPLRIPVPDAAEIEPLASRGYVLVRGGWELHGLDGSSGSIDLHPLGDLGDPPDEWGELQVVDGGLALVWHGHGPPYEHAFFPVCAGPDEVWSRAELPVWQTDEYLGEWTLHDVDDDQREDLSLRTFVRDDVYWRLLRK